MAHSDYLDLPQNQPHLWVMAALRRWDPIGVICEFNQDEYDSYSGDVVQLLDRGAKVDELIEYFRWAVLERMGLTDFDEPASRCCAEELTSFWMTRVGGDTRPDGRPVKFVRFVTESIDPDSGRRQGVFQAASDLLHGTVLLDHERHELQDIWTWFAGQLGAPDRFARAARPHAAPRAISWFKDTAAEHLKRMHAMCRILNDHGIATTMLTSARPGYVVFDDQHQIAAEPFSETLT